MADNPVQDRKLKLPRTHIGKRFLTKYDPSLALVILERIAEGELLKDICTIENGMPAKSTFLKWVAREPELRNAYMAARELSALSFEEEAIAAARELQGSPGTAQKVGAYNAAINQLRWSASRRDPKNYGDKGLAAVVVPIQINTSLDMGTGQKVEAEMPDIYTLEVIPPEPPPKAKPHGRVGPRKQVLAPKVPMDTYVAEKKPERKNAFRSLIEVENDPVKPV